MSEPTKEELLDFMRKYGPEKVDSITDTESAIRHFRSTSKLYKQQRDQYKAESERLERENEQLSELNKQLTFEIRNYEHEIKALRLQANTYFDEWQELKQWYQTHKECADAVYKNKEKQLELLQDFSKFINYKLIVSPASDTYKHYRSELDKLGVK